MALLKSLGTGMKHNSGFWGRWVLGRDTQGVGPEIYEQVSLPPSRETPSPAPPWGSHLWKRVRERKTAVSNLSSDRDGTLTSHLAEHAKLRKIEPKAQKRKRIGKFEQMEFLRLKTKLLM